MKQVQITFSGVDDSWMREAITEINNDGTRIVSTNVPARIVVIEIDDNDDPMMYAMIDNVADVTTI